jgi:hypothetical protein
MCRCGKADRSGTDDCNGKTFGHHDNSFDLSRITKILNTTMTSRGSFGRWDNAANVSAAFVHEVADEGIHAGIVCSADERRRLALLGHEASVDQSAEVMGKRGCRDLMLFLKGADTQACPARPDQCAVEAKPGRVA